MTSSEKGFTYIIIVVILISLITLLVLLIKDTPYVETIAPNLTNNYKQELNYLLDSNFTITDLNNFNNQFYEFIRSHNYEVEICTIIDDGTEIYISNYTGTESKEIPHKETIEINKEDNKTDISFQNCVIDYNSDKKISYYLEIQNEKTKEITSIKGDNFNDSNFISP